MKNDWKTPLDIRVKARLCEEFGLVPLLMRLRSKKAARFRVQLGAEYLFDLEQAVKACHHLQQITEVWEDLHCQAHPPKEDGDEKSSP